MDKQFICDKASECSCLWCEHRIAHKTFLDETECCNHAGFVNCVKGSVCVPVASQSAPSLYEALSTNSQPEAERAEPCGCKNWCETDHRVAFLTNHHSRCPHGGNPLEAAFKLLKELTRGIECWAAEEDGEVYMDCWKPYRKAKALEGVYLADDEKASTTERGTSDPDAVLARSFINILFDGGYVGRAHRDCVLRLADKVEGK